MKNIEKVIASIIIAGIILFLEIHLTISDLRPLFFNHPVAWLVFFIDNFFTGETATFFCVFIISLIAPYFVLKKIYKKDKIIYQNKVWVSIVFFYLIFLFLSAIHRIYSVHSFLKIIPIHIICYCIVGFLFWYSNKLIQKAVIGFGIIILLSASGYFGKTILLENSYGDDAMGASNYFKEFTVYDIFRHTQSVSETFIEASKFSEIKIMKEIIELGFDINSKSSSNYLYHNTDGRCIIHDVILRGGTIESLQFLVDNGIDLARTDDKKRTVMHFAIFRNSKIIQFFINKNVSLNDVDINGQTPMIYYIGGKDYYGNVDEEKVKMLIDADADVLIKDKFNKTAYMYAVAIRDDEKAYKEYRENAGKVAELLLEAENRQRQQKEKSE